MTTTSTAVDDVKPIDRAEAPALAEAENRRMLDLMRTLRDDDWSKPTDCPAWDVRALAGHVLGGMEAFATFGQFVHQMRAGGKAAGDGPFIDGMTAVQVRERADLTRAQLLERMADIGPRVARARGRVPGLFRLMPMKQEVGGVEEKWKMGYLLDVILTRDTWMHRVDITRATGADLVLTAEHDGRILADIVAEWARRHGQPFTLHLEGPAGGTFTSRGGASGSGAEAAVGELITIDAVEYCRILSGRSTGAGLLTQEVPF
jgi:uncharacterized protein (TIGR03083 family)